VFLAFAVAILLLLPEPLFTRLESRGGRRSSTLFGFLLPSQNVPQTDGSEFDEFLKLDRHLSEFVSVRNRVTVQAVAPLSTARCALLETASTGTHLEFGQNGCRAGPRCQKSPISAVPRRTFCATWPPKRNSRKTAKNRPCILAGQAEACVQSWQSDGRLTYQPSRRPP
jgi:hypothetical protein